ncbi:MAG: glucose-1-phosphate thymidylyltransferase [Bacteroidetes bacterium HGW-Bacteroidetes-17]|jgi:UDP-N-acetylglucosamine diphosphorylase/glucosamine-1-phosphate N-acetyltransferase|nr:MAG: glucose-1-phosphate thymidylyltransferase [Bacteroidetes bacterium HGW-Bacteroidetes-17]
MNYILFDTSKRINLLPLTFLRPSADIRIGILTIREKWEKYLDAKTSSLTEDYLSKKFPLSIGAENILINGSVCPSKKLVEKISSLKMKEALVYKGEVIAFKSGTVDAQIIESSFNDYQKIEFTETLIIIENTWDVFTKNGEALIQDFHLLNSEKHINEIRTYTFIGSEENIYIHPSATINYAILNARNGPIYIDEGAEIMEGAMIRGPFYLGKHSQVKMGAKIYGPTTIGPYCKVGGELNNVVMFAYSNKGHEGFLGNAVIGEWCNIGADTNNSNLKNTYDDVRLWNYGKRTFVDTKLQFCGLIMGDHSKTGINTMFNTGTVVGIASNIFGSGYQRNFIPSFSWGSPSKMIDHKLDRAILTAEQVYSRREMAFTEIERGLFSYIFDLKQKDHQI